jgi:predicted RNA-binding Zn-ribbon protein involved in translation (DUF1610 family)
MKEPESMDELVYFTNRLIGKGSAKVWVHRQLCPKCSKELMGKPANDKGKVAIRANEYKCPACGYTVEKTEYESSLTAEAKYTCPSCEKEGEAEVPFKRKNILGVSTLRLVCKHCGSNIDVTKKMKLPKKKGAPPIADE